MQTDNDYKILRCRFGDVLLDEDIFFRIHGTEKPRPYHKFKKITGIFNVRNTIRCTFANNGQKITLSRLILSAKKNDIVDHTSRNPLDNRRSNLRIVNARQSSLNRASQNKTGLFGVTIVMKNRIPFLFAYFKDKTGKMHSFYAKDTENNRYLCALAHDKFVLQSGDEEYAPLNFPCFKYEPFKSFLLKENLYAHKERI